MKTLYTMARYKALMVIAFIIISLTIDISHMEQTNSIDIYPLIYYLNNVVKNVLQENYSIAYNLSLKGLEISVSEDIRLFHEKVYQDLLVISKNYIKLEKIMNLMKTGLINETIINELRDIIRALYRASINIEKDVDEYLKLLYKYPHKYVITPLRASLEKNLVLLTNKIGNDVEDLKNLYLKLSGLNLKTYTGLVSIRVFPERPSCGDYIVIYCELNRSIPSYHVQDINISIIYGLKYTEQYHVESIVGNTFNTFNYTVGLLNIPSIKKLGIPINAIGNKRWVDVVIVVSVSLIVNNTVIRSASSKSINVLAYIPGIRISHKTIINYGENYTFLVVLEDNKPLNISIIVNSK